MSGVEIAGVGHYAPEHVVTNAEIEARLGLEAGWIERRTGIEERRYAGADEALSDIAVRAGDMALANAGIPRSDVALLLLATSTPDHLLPPSAPLVAHRLGLTGAGGIDLAGACAGFIYALTLGDAFARAQGRSVLVIAANILSRRINPADRSTSALFADAAGAAVLAPTSRPDTGLIGAHLAADGANYDLITIPGGGSRMPFATLESPEQTMMTIADGQKVFTAAVDMMVQSARHAMDRASVTPGQVTHFIPHQANARMMSAVAHQLGIAPGRTRSTIEKFGNSSAATIPFTLSTWASSAPPKPGDIVLMTAAGAGLTGGAAVLRW